ncbi:MAG: Methyltransferase type 11 [Phycisphaerales bacterium]|nr:Methyltransferase type 11 [Phycisphaerales bacterium]
MTTIGQRVRGRGGDRGRYVAAAIPVAADRVLDVGCAYGWALGGLRQPGRALVGVDPDAAALRAARASYPDVTFVRGGADRLPFDHDSFDAAIFSDVIGLLSDEQMRRAVDEVHRVLRPGGAFAFTGPHAGLLAWSDPHDFKRRFPGVYKLYMRASGHAPATRLEAGYRHLRMSRYEALLGGRFDMRDVRFCGMFTGPLTWLLVAGSRLRLMPARAQAAVNRFRGWENGLRYPRPLAYNVWIVATKRAAATPSAGSRS